MDTYRTILPPPIEPPWGLVTLLWIIRFWWAVQCERVLDLVGIVAGYRGDRPDLYMNPDFMPPSYMTPPIKGPRPEPRPKGSTMGTQ